MEDGDRIIRLARYITKQVNSRWQGWLRNLGDEVYSAALVAATMAWRNCRSGRFSEDGATWDYNMGRYAYGSLITLLRREGYLPRDARNLPKVFTCGLAVLSNTVNNGSSKSASLVLEVGVAMERLSPVKQRIITLWAAGRSLKSISEELSIPRARLNRNLKDGLNQLRSMLRRPVNDQG